MIYFVSDGNGFIKLGRSTNVNQRIKHMQTGNAHKLVLLTEFSTENDERFEHRLHSKFAKARYRGEWFHADGIEPFIDTIETQIKKHVLEHRHF